MFITAPLLTELSEDHRTRLIAEATQYRLLCECRVQRPGWPQSVLFRLGDSLVSTGEWLKQHSG